jgi:hypothetical protein
MTTSVRHGPSALGLSLSAMRSGSTDRAPSRAAPARAGRVPLHRSQGLGRRHSLRYQRAACLLHPRQPANERLLNTISKQYHSRFVQTATSLQCCREVQPAPAGMVLVLGISMWWSDDLCGLLGRIDLDPRCGLRARFESRCRCCAWVAELPVPGPRPLPMARRGKRVASVCHRRRPYQEKERAPPC